MTDVFTSTHHPGHGSTALVYGRALAGPLGFCMLPVMIAATTAALEQAAVWPLLAWGVPAALLAATLWTRFRLGATPAEIRVRPHQIAVRSMHACLAGAPPDWQRIHEVRRDANALIVTAGFDTYRFRQADWRDHAALLDALRTARSAGARRPHHQY